MDESLRTFAELQRQNGIRKDALIDLLVQVFERQLEKLTPQQIRRRILQQQSETIDLTQQLFPEPGVELLLNAYRDGLQERSYKELADLAGDHLLSAES